MLLFMAMSVSVGQIDRTCVDSNATRLINSQINPCLHTPVTEGTKVEGKLPHTFRNDSTSAMCRVSRQPRVNMRCVAAHHFNGKELQPCVDCQNQHIWGGGA